MRLILVATAGLCLVVLLTACAPSEASLATAIAMTLTAAPTSTPPPPTATPTPTQTPEPTPTPTPDVRVIDTDPENLVLEREDLPAETYYLLQYSEPSPNSYWTEVWVRRTGRILGWYAAFGKGVTAVTSPQKILDSVALYWTAGGANLWLDHWGACSHGVIETDLRIGDATKVCKWADMQPNGRNRVSYWITFTRRNVYHEVLGWGWEGEVEPEFVEQVARTLLKKVDQAPLASKVSFTP